MDESIKINLPNRMDYLPLAIQFIHEVAKHRGFAGGALNQIEVGAEEAIANVMQHAYDAEESRQFEIRCELRPDGLGIVLKETGIPFDPRLIPGYDPGKLHEDASLAGMGTFLLKSVMDEVEFVNLGIEGKETRMFKRLEGAAGPVSLPEEPAAAGAPAVLQEKIPYTVRGMEPAEAVEISRCAYKSHGYSFFDDHIYFPEKLVEMNRTGQMISAVAVTGQGTFMGHAALLYQDMEDRIAELTFVFVNVEYRGQGAFNRLIEFLFHEPKPRPLDGIYAYAVANHVFTQKATVRYGINDCGILLATSPASWKFKGIPGDPEQRISVVLSFKYTNPPAPLVLYPPPQHREMISRLYQNIGAEHRLENPPEGAPVFPEGETRLEIGENKLESCAEIYVTRYGAGAVPALRRRLRRFCLDGYAAINLFLSLEDPLTGQLVAEIEQAGFFFAGILPCTRIGDALMLQYLNNVDVHYDKISAYSEMAREILAYIRARDPNASL